MKLRTETEQAMSAMNRAAESARIKASRFGTNLAIWRDGAVVLIKPKTEQNPPPKSDRTGG